MEIPKGHQAAMPYLIIKGASSFSDFAKSVFDAELTSTRMREDGTTIMHAELQIGGSTIMFAESTEEWKPSKGSIFVYVDNADEAYKKAIGIGAATLMELSDEDYGRTCGIIDPFGTIWWITSLNI